MRIMLIIAGLMVLTGCNKAQEPQPPGSAPVRLVSDRDSSSVEQGHRAADPAAPLDNPKNPVDEDVTAAIRKKMLDTEMSPNLQNVTVTTKDGSVTLRGTVKTVEEKSKVEEIARATDGAKSVENWIETE